MAVDKPHNNNTWTDARKKSFIVSALRSAFSRWGPKQMVVKNARVRRGVYLCEGCNKEGPASLPPLEGNKLRRKNIAADHIDPIVDPEVGFVDYNTWIERGFVESEAFQALCWQCHTGVKTKEENKIRSLTKAYKKDHPMEHGSWRNMKSRCDTPSSTGYENYGGRGITYDDSWNDFPTFLKDMGPRTQRESLDRINVNGDYTPINCRWATRKQQGNNKRTNHLLSYEGECMTISEWGDVTGIHQHLIFYRIKRGWSVAEALGMVPRSKPSTSRLTKDEWREVALLRVEGLGTVELGSMFNIDPSAITRQTNKVLTSKEKAVIKEHISRKASANGSKGGRARATKEERAIATKRRADER